MFVSCHLAQSSLKTPRDLKWRACLASSFAATSSAHATRLGVPARDWRGPVPESMRGPRLSATQPRPQSRRRPSPCRPRSAPLQEGGSHVMAAGWCRALPRHARTLRDVHADHRILRRRLVASHAAALAPAHARAGHGPRARHALAHDPCAGDGCHRHSIENRGDLCARSQRHDASVSEKEIIRPRTVCFAMADARR